MSRRAEKMDFELIPAIDLKGGKCVRLQEGDAARATEYGDDPVATALHWQEQGALRVHLVDLDGAFTGNAAHLDVARRIFGSLRVPVQFGGGLRTLDQIWRVLDLGASQAILGTVAAEDPGLVEHAAVRWPERILVGIDARGGMVALRGWIKQTGMSAVDLARRMSSVGIRRVIYTDVARDGMLRGVNLQETESLARQSGVGVVASGGVSSEADVHELWRRRESGIEGVILGRALYERRIEFDKLVNSVKSWNESGLGAQLRQDGGKH